MSVLKRWVIPGLVAVGAVTGVSLYSETEKIEKDLTDRTSEKLAAAGMDWATLTFDGRDGTLTGVAPREGAAKAASDLALKEWGVRVVSDETTLLAEQKPFTWSLERKGQDVAMSGFLPHELIKSTPNFISEQIKDSQVVADVKAARGAPENLDEALGISAAILNTLPNGKADLVDSKLTITGELEDGNEEHVALFAKLQDLVGKADLGKIELAMNIPEPKKPEPPKPVEPAPTADADLADKPNGLVITRTENGVGLNGLVPSQQVKDDLLTLAKRKFGFGGVEDQLAIKEGADIAGLSADKYAKAATAALQAVSRLGEGKAELLSEGLSLDGGAFYDGALAQVQNFLKSALPEGLTNTANLSVVAPGEAIEAEQCQVMLKSALERNSIYFDSGKANISNDSYGLLDTLIYTARRCPESKIQIEGHTDSDGQDAANQTLSEKRAAAVKGYLEAAGMSAERLAAVGYGETKPVASNDTAEGKAKNRRIEFVILAQ